MRVTPRGPEVKAIVELLESDDYDSADALAKAILKRTGELFAEREWYAWVWKESGSDMQLAWGPVSSESEARKLSSKVGLIGQHMFLPLYSTAALLARLAEKPTSPFCSTCNHPHHCHEHPKFGGKCAARGCKCQHDTN